MDALSARLRRAWGRVLGADVLRFAAVGAMGFAVDAGVLTALIATGSAGPIAGRLVSFACAVLATFEANRRFSFRGAAARPYLAMLAAYLGVQGAGFLCNLAVYWTALLLLPRPFGHPLICLALASGVALVVNFAGARLLVFRAAPGPGGARRPGGEPL